MENNQEETKNNVIENADNLDAETSKSLRLKKVLKERFSKFQSRYEKLKVFNSKPHTHFEILIVGFVFSIIFLIFSLILLFSTSFITKGYAIPEQQFFSPDVDTTSYNSSANFLKIYGFCFGLYHYTFKIAPVPGDSITALINNHNGIAKIIGTYLGPDLTWYGICYVIFEFFILTFIISSFVVFFRYNSFLKYVNDGYKIKRYFTASYALIITFIVLSGLITEINVIPGSSVIEWLLDKYDPSLAYPPVHNVAKTHTSSSSSASSKDIEKYINDLSTNGVGIIFPISAFAQIKVRIVQEPSINNNEPAFFFNIYTAWYCWIIFVLYLGAMSACVYLLVILSKKYEKHAELLQKLCDMSITDNLYKDEKPNNQVLNLETL